MSDSIDTAQKPKTSSIVLVVMFCLIIAIPCVGTVFGWDLYPPKEENRKLAEWSELKGVPVGEMPMRFGACFKDNFAFRNLLIRRFTKLRRNITGSRSDRVLVGKDKWLFFNRQGSILDYRGAGTLNDADLKRWIDSFHVRTDWLKQRGVHYLFVIPPDKIQMYPEKLPDNLRKLRGRARSDQIMQAVASRPGLDILYLKQALLDAKDGHVLYLANDTHWNDRGAFVAHQSILTRLKRKFPNWEPAPESAFTITPSVWKGDLGRMIGLENKYATPRERFVPKSGPFIMMRPPLGGDAFPRPPMEINMSEMPKIDKDMTRINPKGKGRAIVFHDSFTTFGLREILPEVFAEVTFITGYSDEEQLKKYVDALKPDVVIDIMGERRMGHMHSFETTMKFCAPFSTEK